MNCSCSRNSTSITDKPFLSQTNDKLMAQMSKCPLCAFYQAKVALFKKTYENT